MMNTLDLSVDQMFWELEHNPWVVKNLLDNFAKRYSYVDQLQTKSGKLIEGGVSFTHDMGVHNNFSPPGYSSYELAHLTGCFSYMTAEQLCNWLLIAATYASSPNADPAWVQRNRHIVRAAGQSLLNRCGDTGVIQYDSSRCVGPFGPGAEITTYDSLDHSLAQTRNNLYIATKCWATFLALEQLLPATDGDSPYLASAHAAARTVLRHVMPDGSLPAVFEKDNPGHSSRILPAIEALIYPYFWQTPDIFTADSDFAPFIAALKNHTLALLKDPQHRNIFPDGGVKLSSTSNNSWMSKIAIFLYVAREILQLHDDPEVAALLAKADTAHARWQTVGSAFWACSDQFVSGEAKGSRYYPRIITSALWLHESITSPRQRSMAPDTSRQHPLSNQVT